jgi:hypothetical protein
MDIQSFLENSDLRTHLKTILYSLAKNLYNDLYIYVWLICFYNVILILLLLGILALLVHTLKTSKSSLPTKLSFCDTI